MWATLKNKDFSIFVYSQTVSQFGDKLDYIALIGIIGLYPEVRNPFLMSLLAFFTTAPVVIFGPIAGVLVDRWHKKKVMVVCDALRMLCAFMIPVVYLTTHNIYPVFLVVFFLFLFTLFFNAARSAIIPNLVTKKYILRANSVINFVGRAATFLGILLGGLIVVIPADEPRHDSLGSRLLEEEERPRLYATVQWIEIRYKTKVTLSKITNILGKRGYVRQPHHRHPPGSFFFVS